MQRISSRANSFYKSVLRLSQSARERRRTAQTLLDGEHLVEAYAAKIGTPRTLIVSAGLNDARDRQLPGWPARVVLDDDLFAAISPVTTPTGVLALIDIPRRAAPRDPNCCVMLEGIQDPGNLGSILRTSAAAGAPLALLSRECADAWSPRVLRAAMGGHFGLAIREAVDLTAAAATFRGRVIAAAADASATVFETDLTGPVAFAFGAEGSGLSESLAQSATLRVRIPMPGGCESLNVAAAAAIFLFERVRQMNCRPTSHRGETGSG